MIRNFARRAVRVLRGTKAVTAAEYAILAVGVVVIVGASAAVFGPQVKTAFTNVGTQIGTQQDSVTNAMK